jgi:transposase-like protein
MPINSSNYPAEVIPCRVSWYLRDSLAYAHVTELMREQGLAVDGSCVWRWVLA